MELITITAKTYDEAVTKALLELQTTSEHMHVEVVQKETTGLFGVLGGKNCIIKAGVMSEEEEAAEKQAKAEAEKAAKEAEEKAAKEAAQKAQSVEELSDELKEKIAKQNEKIAQRRQAAQSDDSTGDSKESQGETQEESGSHIRHERPIKPISEEQATELTKKAQDFLNGLFAAMGSAVNAEFSFDHATNEMGVVLSGDDMGILIGKRGQTLDSLQYLTSLVVNKGLDGYIRVKMDTENYRQRREDKLTILANNIAHKVARTGEAVSLEPMNPYERRIIHSALQADKFVTTDSEGEDPYRHIVIKPKSGAGRSSGRGYGHGGYGRRSGGGHRPRQ